MAANEVRDLRHIVNGNILGYVAFNDLRIHHRIDIHFNEFKVIDGLETLPDGILGNKFRIVLSQYLPAELYDHFSTFKIDLYLQ